MEIIETLHQETFTILEKIETLTQRQLSFPQANDVIKVAIGMRRSGKTYFLYQTINNLLTSGISKQRILMINFEDDRLLPMTSKQMGALLDSFYSLYPENHDRCCYLFLDEVQNIPDWNQVIRRYFDSKNVQIYLTGSSAKLLSKEIATSLRGRSLSVDVFPYSFAEYCITHHIAIPEKPHGQKTYDIMTNHLRTFFKKGGFPAVQHMLENEWRETLQSYVDTVILRDIVERHNVSNINLLKYLTKTLLKNAATVFSINKFYNDIKSQGHKVSKTTISTYLSYLEDTFLIFALNFYSESEREKQNVPKKIYTIDNSLINAMSLGTNDMVGKCLENQIFLDLRRQGKEIYFYRTKDGFEIDFVVINKDGSKELIQVCADMSSAETANREQRALEQAEKELGIKGKIITLNDYLKSFLQG